MGRCRRGRPRTPAAVTQHIELGWPGKGLLPEQMKSGSWGTVELRPATVCAYPLTVETAFGERPSDSLVVVGDRLDALSTLRLTMGDRIKLVYADLPRVEGYDDTRAFRAENGRTWGTWLTVVREHLAAAAKLLARDGILVIQGGDREEAYAKILAHELLGPDNMLGSIVWQSHYSPKGGKPGSEIATIHDTLVCVARERDQIGQIALPRPAVGYSNADDDPRGPWKAPQKDAGRDTVKLTYNIPPYRWQQIAGSLPPGLWRISPFSGVLWGTPTEVGSWRFKLKVRDQVGSEVAKTFTLQVDAAGDAPEPPKRIWWMDQPPTKGGKLRISSSRLARAVIGRPYSFIVEAEGGEPHLGTKRPSRGWGFGERTLIDAIREDRCYFGLSGSTIPEPKRYLRSLADGISYANVTSWWSGDEVGWSQDATKHLRALKAAGVIREVVETAKPELLIQRVIEAFSSPGDSVLELFARAGDAAAVSMSLGRAFIALSGGSENDILAATECCVPRLKAVLDGIVGASQVQATVAIPAEAAISGFTHARVDEPVAITDPTQDEFPHLVRGRYTAPERLSVAILTSQGYVPAAGDDGLVIGRSVGGRDVGVVLLPDSFLDRNLAADLGVQATAERGRTTVYFFRSDEDFDAAEFAGNISFKRVPMDLAL